MPKGNKAKNAKSVPRAPKSRAQTKSVSAPVAQSKQVKHLGRPKITPLGKAGDTLVVHREFIGDLVSAAAANAFQAIGLPINAGNIAMFPWLSQIAINFESYVFRSLKFLFETDAATTSAGSLLMAVDYDSHEDLPETKQELMSRQDAERSPIWSCLNLDCKKENLHKRKTYYVADKAAPSELYELVGDTTAADDRLEDVGELIVASSNCASSTSLGELYVEYEVELLTPDSSIDSSDFFVWYANNGDPSWSLTAAKPMGASIGTDTTAKGSFNPATFSSTPVRYDGVSGSNSTIWFGRPGTYFYAIYAAGWTTSSGTLTWGGSTSANVAKHSIINFYTGSGAGAAYAVQFGYIVIDPALPDPVSGDIGWVTFSLGGTGVGATAGSSCYTVARFALVPDYFQEGIGGGHLPKPLGSKVHVGRKKKARGISCIEEHICSMISLAGNGPEGTQEQPASSSKEEDPSLLDPPKLVPEFVTPVPARKVICKGRSRGAGLN